jgi:hypothetical protein
LGVGEVCDVTLCSLPDPAEPELVPTDEDDFGDDVEPLEPDTPLELAELFETVVEVLLKVLPEVLVEALVEAAPGSGENGLRELPRRCWEAPLVISATAPLALGWTGVTAITADPGARGVVGGDCAVAPEPPPASAA